MDDLKAWLDQHGLEEHIDLFREQQVRVSDLMMFTEDDVFELGLPLGPRKRLLAAIEALRSEERTAQADTPSEDAPTGGAERRQLTVMFCDLVGSTALSEQMDPEEYREILSRYQTAAREVIGRHEGYIARYMGDGLLIYFGYPLAHEDDAARAIRAGLGVVEAIAALTVRPGIELSVRIGLDTGPVVVGDIIGEGASEESAVLGETPNRAARLQAVAAPNSVVIGPGAKQLVEGLFHLESLGELSLKGISSLVSAYRVKGESGARTRFEAAERRGFASFVGREHELATLQSCHTRVARGEGQFVSVMGDAGVGKSRLLYEFRQQLDTEKSFLVEGRCDTYGISTPYLPFIDALRRGLNLNVGDSPEQLHDKAVTNTMVIDPALEVNLPLYLHLLSIESETYPLPKRLQGPELAAEMRKALAAFFTLSAEVRPMVVLLEDWHWADTASVAALKHLFGVMGSHSLMVIVTHRPESPTDWDARSYHSAVVLQPLDHEHTAAIAERLWQVSESPDALTQVVHEQTGGNPFFVEQICEELLEDGTVKREGDTAVLTRPIGQISVPPTVQAVIRSRLDRLDRDARDTLGLASVIGREFSGQVLEFAAAKEGVTLAALAPLIDMELIQQVRFVPEATYRFKHVLTQEVAYETLLRKRRRELHRQIGGAIEELYAARLDEHVELLTHHFAQAEEWDKAARHGHRAGDKATSLSQFLVAAQFHERTFEWLLHLPETQPRNERMVDALLQLSWASASLGKWEEMEAAMHSAEPLATQLDDRVRMGFVKMAFGNKHQYTGNAAAAESFYSDALRYMEESGDAFWIAACKQAVGSASLGPGQWARAEPLISDAVRRYEKLDSLTAPILSSIMVGPSSYVQAGYCLAVQGRNEEAAANFFKAAAPGLQGLCNLQTKTLYLSWHSLYVALVGEDRAGASEHADAAVQVAEASDSIFQQLGAYLAKTNILLGLEEFEDVLSYGDKALDAIAGKGIRTGHIANLHYNLAQTHLALGDCESAREHYTEGLPVAEPSRHWWRPRFQLLEARIISVDHDPDYKKAETLFRESAEGDAEVGALVPAAQTRYYLANVLMQKGQVKAAKDLLIEVRCQFEDWKIPRWQRKCVDALEGSIFR